ncbi:MAG: helix-turn-helix transcriptional regulator [Clostridia bacterium]|nr:helix-turn-helix transcriptional regulator [Clostridia bacterium]
MLGDNIFKNRKKSSLSQEDLAEKLNVSRQSISLWETNQAMPSVDNLMKLAEIFDVSLDELCNDKKPQKQEELKNESENEVSDGYFATATTKFQFDKYLRALKMLNKKHYILIPLLLSLCVVYAIVCFATAAKPVGVFFVLLSLFLLSSLFSIDKRIKKSIETEAKNTHNLQTYFYFYHDHIEIISKSDNSNTKYVKNYSDFSKKVISEDFICLVFDNRFVVIDLESISCDKDTILKLLQLTKVPSGQSKKIKTLLPVLFILTLASLLLALMSTAIAVETSPIPESPYSMIEYMWLFFVFLPIPITSIVLGFIFLRKKYRCKKNIIAGFIIAPLLVIYGAFSFLPPQANHDYSYISKIESTTSISLPDNGYVSYTEEYSNFYSFAMARFDESEVENFVSDISKDSRWKTDYSFIPAKTLDLYHWNLISDYDYFCVYDKYLPTYNDFTYANNHELILMAYEKDTNLLIIIDFTYTKN